MKIIKKAKKNLLGLVNYSSIMSRDDHSYANFIIGAGKLVNTETQI
jgi:hypothetical protein